MYVYLNSINDLFCRDSSSEISKLPLEMRAVRSSITNQKVPNSANNTALRHVRNHFNSRKASLHRFYDRWKMYIKQDMVQLPTLGALKVGDYPRRMCIDGVDQICILCRSTCQSCSFDRHWNHVCLWRMIRTTLYLVGRMLLI